jgi:hypothetical protein
LRDPHHFGAALSHDEYYDLNDEGRGEIEIFNQLKREGRLNIRDFKYI